MKNTGLLLIVVAEIVCVLALGLTDVQAQDTSNVQVQVSLAQAPPLRLKAFADRAVVKKAERFTVRVWVMSEVVDTADLTIFFAEEHLSLQEGSPTRSVILPMTAPSALFLPVTLRAHRTCS